MTSGINFKGEKKIDKMRDFKTRGVTEEDALCGNGKGFVHKYRICLGLMAQVSPCQKLEISLAGLETDSRPLQFPICHSLFELQVTGLEPCLWFSCSAELSIH